MCFFPNLPVSVFFPKFVVAVDKGHFRCCSRLGEDGMAPSLLLLVVPLNMSLEGAHDPKSVSAIFTCERSLLFVDKADVLIEVFLEPKVSIAFLTLEGFLLLVYRPNMS